MKCEDCDGTGIIGKDEWVEECLMCDGSGAVTPNRICESVECARVLENCKTWWTDCWS